MFDESCEPYEFASCSLVDRNPMSQRVATDIEQRVVLVTHSSYLAYRSVAYATAWVVDDALESFFIGCVCYESEVCYDVLYFLALIERKPSEDAVFYPAFSERLLKVAALCIGAVEYSAVTIIITLNVM